MQERTRVKSPPPKFLDLNILPDQYRRRKLSLRAARPWLFVVAYALLVIPTHRLYASAANELNRVEVELVRVQSALDDYEPLTEEKDAFASKIEEVESQIDEIETIAQSSSIQEITWGNVLRLIVRTVPVGIELTMVEQSGYEVVIIGVAENRQLPPSLADALKESGLFANVVINSLIKILPPEPKGDEVPTTIPLPKYEFEISLDLDGKVEEIP